MAFQARNLDKEKHRSIYGKFCFGICQLFDLIRQLTECLLWASTFGLFMGFRSIIFSDDKTGSKMLNNLYNLFTRLENDKAGLELQQFGSSLDAYHP